VISRNYQYVELSATGGNAYPSNAEIAAALRVHSAGLEERLAWLLAATSFKSFAAGSGSSECDKGHSKENGGFEELHGYGGLKED
jgi:hypothetical protein